MSLIEFVLTLLVVAVVMWVIDLIPMKAIIKQVMNVAVLVVVVIWVLNAFGVIGYLSHIMVPRAH